MVTIVLLMIIYLAFISLGLPDALLGTAWPVIHTEWGVALDSAGIISFTITGGTVISSLMSGYIIKRFGTGKVTLISCLMTGLALLGFSFSSHFYWLILLAIPLGIGAGSVDTALNNYVALHFKAHHMNWLHSFWGVGATLGPIIMSLYLGGPLSWRGGFRTVSLIQLSLAVLLFISLPLWGKHQAEKQVLETEANKTYRVSLLKTRGLILSLATFLFYCSVELSIGLWGATYLVQNGMTTELAAQWLGAYYGSITIGRFLCGFISLKVNNTIMIRSGIIIAIIGTGLLFLDLPIVMMGTPFALIGLGLAPIFPALLHETPRRFGKQVSQTIIGYQMAAAYVGSALAPPMVGLILNRISMGLFPILMFAGLMLILGVSEGVLKRIKIKEA